MKPTYVLHLGASSFIRTDLSLTSCCHKSLRYSTLHGKIISNLQFTIKEVVSLFTVTLLLNACMCGPSQRSLSVESGKGFLGYHLQCCSKWAGGHGGRKTNTNMLICLVLLPLRLKIQLFYQEVKEL